MCPVENLAAAGSCPAPTALPPLTSYVMAAAMVMEIASFQLAAMAIGCLYRCAAKEQQIPKYQRANDEDVSH